jgi:MoxR-like ATPase
MSDPAELYNSIYNEVSTILVGHDHLVEHLTISLLTGGHILLEGVPGVAKTTLANAFARAIGLEYNRVQMTPDILPADITGTTVYRQQTGDFELQRGPVFANVVVADEINRATPKTQSALLEAMEEGHVSIEGDTLPLPDPFMVIATQNPIEMEGTFELPEAQRDRFQFKLTVDTPSHTEESEILNRFDNQPSLGSETVTQVVERNHLSQAREYVSNIYIGDTVQDYILNIVERTRSHSDIEYGASPRASLALMHTSKAKASINGRDYVIPDDIKSLATPVLVHRLVLNTEAKLSDISPSEIIQDILTTVTSPSNVSASPTD